MAIEASIDRIGPGFGASGGMCIIYITGVANPQRLSGHQEGGWDFNLSLGGNWAKLAKINKLKKLKPLIDLLTKLGANTPAGLKKLLKAHPDKWVELIKKAKEVKDTLGIDPTGDPNVLMLGPIPIGIMYQKFAPKFRSCGSTDTRFTAPVLKAKQVPRVELT